MWPPEYAASGKQAPVVVDVWADNEEEELAHISRGLLVDFPIAVVATYQDLPARPLRDAGHLAFHDNVYHVVHSPRHTLEHHCRVLQDRIRGVRFFQLILALLDRDGAVALGRVWRFHVGAPLPADDRLLLELGVAPPARRRVHRDHIWTSLMACNAIHNTAVTWVTCDGADDVCHLMSCFDDPEIVRQVSSRMNFVRNSRSFFPQLYDLRFLAEWRTLAGEEPPLAAAARAGGPAALLHGFLALMKEPTFAEQMEGYNGILFGIGHLDTPDIVNRYKMSREERHRRYRMEFCRKRC